MPPILSEKLTQLRGKKTAINLLEGETLEQAEARVQRDRPELFAKAEQDFGAAAAGSDEQTADQGAMSPETKKLFEIAQQFSPGSIQRNRVLTEANAAYKRDQDKRRPKSESELKEDTKNRTVDDVKNALLLLEKIETKPGIVGRLNQAYQKGSNFFGFNPELQAYQDKVDILSSPIVKGIQAATGNPSDYEQKKAEKFLPQGPALFISEYRQPALQNTFDSIKARTGRDLTTELTPEQLKKIGYLGKLLNQNNSAPSGDGSLSLQERARKALERKRSLNANSGVQ